MVNETWIHIKGFEGHYIISSNGRVMSLQRAGLDGRKIKQKMLKLASYPNGYKFVSLRKNGNTFQPMVHRLVAKHFCDNPFHFNIVNHKDGDKSNNRACNLEWCTNSYNRKHAYDNGFSPQRGKPVQVLVTNNNYMNLFETMTDACKFFGFKKCWLHNRARKLGKTFTYKGFKIQIMKDGV